MGTLWIACNYSRCYIFPSRSFSSLLQLDLTDSLFLSFLLFSSFCLFLASLRHHHSSALAPFFKKKMLLSHVVFTVGVVGVAVGWRGGCGVGGGI